MFTSPSFLADTVQEELPHDVGDLAVRTAAHLVEVGVLGEAAGVVDERDAVRTAPV
jgi:hypothetical protein